MEQHKGIRRALQFAYPGVDFKDGWVVDTKPKGYWTRLANCKKFFDELAAEHGFDPEANKEAWKGITAETVCQKKVSTFFLFLLW